MSVNRDNIINKIKPAGSTGAEYTIAPTIMVDTTTNYSASLPTLAKDSVIALTSDLPTNYVTLDTAQTISGTKTFSVSPVINNNVALQGKTTDGTVKRLILLTSNNNVSVNADGQGLTYLGGVTVLPTGNGAVDLGSASVKWKDIYLNGALKNSTYTFSLPSATGTLALTSQIPTVNNGTLTIQKNGSDVATFTANQSTNVTANITVPTVSDYYWADVKVSASSNKGTTPTVSTIAVGGSGSTAGKATMQYNATEDCIEFIFA